MTYEGLKINLQTLYNTAYGGGDTSTISTGDSLRMLVKMYSIGYRDALQAAYNMIQAEEAISCRYRTCISSTISGII